MKSSSGYTVSELMKKSGKTRGAIEAWISRHKIKPISYEARYPDEILEQIKSAKRGGSKKGTKKP